MKRALLILSIALVVVAAAGFQKPSINSAPGGRYQIVINPNVRADTFLLDTETGRIWQRTGYSDLQGDPDAWMFQQRIDNMQEFSAWLDKQTFKATKPKDH